MIKSIFKKNKHSSDQINSNKNPLYKICVLTFIMSIKNEKSWVFINFISLILTIFIIFSYSTYMKNYEMYPPQYLTFLSIPTFITSSYFVIMLNEWKETYMLKRLKFIGIKGWHIIFAYLLTSLFFLFLSEALTFLFLYIVSLFAHQINFKYIQNLFWWNWIYFILTIILIDFTIFSICIFLTSFTKLNFNLRFLICISVTLILFLLSDTSFISFIGSRNYFLTYIGYVIPTKYCTWIILLSSSFAFVDYDGGIQQIISDPTGTKTTVFISNLYLDILISVLFFTVFIFLAIKFFRWK